MKHKVQFVVIVIFLTSFCGAESPSSIPVECTKPRGPNCVIKWLPPSDGIKTKIAFPDLSTRTTLRVSEGTLSNLTKALAQDLTVRNLWMEGIGLKSVFVSPAFEELHLRDNKLTTLETSTSLSHSFALKLLDVSKNMLKNVSLLVYFGQLEELYLDDNQIDQLSMDMFATKQYLRVLSASANGMVKIVPPASMLMLSKLESLSLSHNQLTAIELENWQLPSLQKLQLNNNRLEELTGVDEFNQYYDLRELKLAGNTWSCGWLQHALANVIVRKSLHDSEGIVLDSDTDCSIEKVLGICCKFTPMSDHEEEHNFLPEIGKVREAVSAIERRHEAFMRYESDKLKELKKELQQRLDQLKSYLADQENESERAKIQATHIMEKEKQLSKTYAQVSSDMETARNIEQQRKQLLHFMVYMKNQLLRQAIDTDSLWVQANAEKINLIQRVENAPKASS